jgi:protocatechuate 4,5-dioxygenase alpha chain
LTTDAITDPHELDDIPGTTVFTIVRSRQGYWLNQFCMTLLKSEHRDRFRADERAYLDEWKMSEAAKQAVLARDFNGMIAEGGNIYFLAKLMATDGQSVQQGVASMTGSSQADYAAMMLAGGRSPDGLRSKTEGR